MGRKRRVYLDTSVISALFDKRNPDRKRITEQFFRRLEDFEVFISDITTGEISRTHSNKLRTLMWDAVEHFEVLSVTDEIKLLGKAYIAHGAIPSEKPEDAYHIATAVMNEVEYLASWNFLHIVRMKTRAVVDCVNRCNNLGQINILTPGELV